MNKFLIVGLAICGAMGWAGQAQSNPVAMDTYVIEYSGIPLEGFNSSVVWTDVTNFQRSKQMERVDGVLPFSAPFTLPSGSHLSVSAFMSSHKPVIIKILHNGVECDTNPTEVPSIGMVKTCKP